MKLPQRFTLLKDNLGYKFQAKRPAMNMIGLYLLDCIVVGAGWALVISPGVASVLALAKLFKLF